MNELEAPDRPEIAPRQINKNNSEGAFFQTSVILNRKDTEALDAIGKGLRRDRSDLVREAVRDWLQRKGK